MTSQAVHDCYGSSTRADIVDTASDDGATYVKSGICDDYSVDREPDPG